MMRQIFATLVLLCFWGGATFAQITAAPSPQEMAKPAPGPGAAQKNDYGNGDNWLCRPGRQDACAVDQSTTVISAEREADGGTVGRRSQRAHRLFLRVSDGVERFCREQRHDCRPGRKRVWRVYSSRVSLPNAGHMLRCTGKQRLPR